jgi:hypothetical protein
MSKKRKTREQKIILQLKRQLAQGTKTESSQEAISLTAKKEEPVKLSVKKPGNLSFSFNSKLIKKDVFKTLILSLTIISLEVVLYLRLR